MAFLAKNAVRRSTGPDPGAPQINQAIQVTRAAKALPASTTQQLFKVKGGRVLVKALIGEVTTVIEATDPIAKVSSQKLNAALDTAVGTAVDVASTVDISSLEVGGSVFVEGDGTALVKSNAGAIFVAGAGGSWIAPQGQIYLTTGATKTGALKWDIFYEPLDPGASVVAVDVATAKV